MYPQPFPSLDDAIRLNAQCRPNHVAFVCGNQRATWRQFNEHVNRIANTLAEIDGESEGAVAMLMGNTMNALEMMFAVFRLARTLVPISTLLTPEQAGRMLEDSGATICVVDAPNQHYAMAVSDIYASSVSGHLLGVGFESNAVIDLAQLVQTASNACPVLRHKPDDVCNIIYSSGTTGVPKGIAHTNRARLFFSLILGIAFGIGRDAISIVTTPLYTNGTWLTLMPTALAGGTTVLLSKFEPGDFLERAMQCKATHTFLVPTQFRLLADWLDAAGDTAHAFKSMITAGSFMPGELWQRIEAHFGDCLCELYGLTEGIGTVKTTQEAHTAAARSVGCALPLMDIRIVSAEGVQLGANEEGEIVGRSPTLMCGYHNRAEASRDALWQSPDDNTYVRTGDHGYLDEGGFLYLLGRKKDMIVSGGLNVHLADIEAVLREHPAVADAVAIGIADVKWGETPIAAVIVESANLLEPDDLKHWANQKLARHQRIKQIVLWDGDFPRNALGKVVKQDIHNALDVDDSK